MIKAIAVDDEVPALDVIRIHCEKSAKVELIKTFTSSLSALSYLKSNPVDLVFLDINMPDLNGLQFLEQLEVHPYVILTTAHDEYAVKSYEYEIIDYLLKPIRYSRFSDALIKIEKRARQERSDRKKLSLKSGHRTLSLFPDEIHYLESYGNFVKVFHVRGMDIVNASLKKFVDAKELPLISRVHKSFAVNIKRIDEIHSSFIVVNSTKIPVGRAFKNNLKKALKEKL